MFARVYIKVRKKRGVGANNDFFNNYFDWHNISLHNRYKFMELTTCVQIDMRSLVRYWLDGKFHASASLCIIVYASYIFCRTILYLVDTFIKRALAEV